MSLVTRAIQRAVSGNRSRYIDGTYDLDLTYITDRIIAMGFPGEGVVSMYRNDGEQIAKFLNEKHPGKYMIWNLSERKYDYSRFDNQVLEYGFPDHHSPPLELMFSICSSIHSWLTADPLNVAVVHCLAGKGRTGTVIALYLLYCGLFSDEEDALEYFAIKRTPSETDITKKGVTSPSQRRYVEYFNRILKTQSMPPPTPLILKRILIHNLPAKYMSQKGDLKLEFEFFEMVQTGPNSVVKKLLYNTKDDTNLQTYTETNSFISLDINVKLKGDILIRTKYKNLGTSEKVFRFSFYTGFVSADEVFRLKKSDIDECFRNKAFTDEFFMDLYFVDPVLTAEKPRGRSRATLDGTTAQKVKAEVDKGNAIWNEVIKQHRSTIEDSSSKSSGLPYARQRAVTVLLNDADEPIVNNTKIDENYFSSSNNNNDSNNYNSNNNNNNDST